MTTKNMVITIPGHLPTLTTDEQRALEQLLRNFGNARRRAYQLKRKGASISDIEKLLQRDHHLNGRYAKDAYYSIKSLPLHVTFGGLHNQRLREQGRISCEEYGKRRNGLLISRGEQSKKGNLNLRFNVQDMTLRVTLPHEPWSRRWMFLRGFISTKYLARYGSFLDGSHPYMVVIVRREDDQGFDVRFTITQQCYVDEEAPRVLTLDVNAGHTDFAVVDKHRGRVEALGRIHHHETQYRSRARRTTLLHHMATKIGNLAHHYAAEVVVGHLNTGKFRSKSRRAYRVVRQMPQYRFRQILTHKLIQRGINVITRSEAYTSRMGEVLSAVVGLDVHKCAAAVFAIKVLQYPLFRELKALMLSDNRCSSDEDDGSLRRTRPLRGQGELTAPHQDRRVAHVTRVTLWYAMKLCDKTALAVHSGGYSATPCSWGLSFMESLFHSAFAQHHIKLC